MKQPNTSRRLLILGCAASVALVGAMLQLGVAPAFAANKPRGTVCEPSESFSVGGYNYQDLGNGNSSAWTWLHNTNAKTSTLSLSFSTNSTVSYSISSTQGADAGIIFASASASVTEGISYSHTDNKSTSAGVSVPAHDYGEIGADNVYAVGHGTTTDVLGNCDVRKYTVTSFKFPTNEPVGYETGTTTSVPSAPPWPLAP